MTRQPLFFKLLILGLLTLLLLIPLKMIESKISDRQGLQINVQNNIALSASGPQTLSGPFLVITYKLRERVTKKDDQGNQTTIIKETGPHSTLIAPQTLKINADTDVETRKRGIYKARLYNVHSKITGDFIVPRGFGIGKPIDDIIPEQAFLVMGISDSRGIRNNPPLIVNNEKYEFEAGNLSPAKGSGIHADLTRLEATKAHSLNFEFPLELQGMTTFTVTPSGNNTEMNLSSAWPHPSFTGQFLPRSHAVSEQGFKAAWQISKLARNATAGDAETFAVQFIDPVNIYLQSERAVKYGVMFVVLIFTAFFLFEVLLKLRIHPMQYLLVGLAMAMFFLLIISLSEHISFALAYIVSGTACVVLIGAYLVGVMQSRKPAYTFTTAIALLYAVLYGVLQSEDNALLMGSLVLFAALATVMLLTRKLDWYRVNEISPTV